LLPAFPPITHPTMAPKTKAKVSDDLAHNIADGLNTDGLPTYFLGQDASPTDLVDFVSTGSSILDLNISNRPNGGIACGRITELTGLEGSGKSLIAAHMMANVQRSGGVAVLLDTENAVNQEFYDAIGLDFDRMVYRQPETVEEIFETIEKIVELYRKGTAAQRDKKVIIVVDSVAAAPTKREVEGDYDKDGYATDKAIIIGKAMRKLTNMIGKYKITLVFTNQLRQKMNAMPFSDPWTTSGGKAIAFHASTRIRLARAGFIKNKAKDVIGVTINADVVKNRLGPPHRKCSFDVYFDRGIDDLSSWTDFLKDHSLITGNAAKYKYIDSNGEEFEFSSSTWKSFVEEKPEVKADMYNRMCNTLIMSYKTDGLSTDSDEVEVETSGDGA